MPYGEDGDTWDQNYMQFKDGSAENKPGHKPFVNYNLPSWAKHPLTHPFSGVFLDVDSYTYRQSMGTSALDGHYNYVQKNTAHIGAAFGDLEMLEQSTEAELNSPNVFGATPASETAQNGMAWAMQWLVEHGADTKSPDQWGYTPEEQIYSTTRNHNPEVEWCAAAEKGELTEKKIGQAQEYKLKRWRFEGIDNFCADQLDRNKKTQISYMYKTGEIEMPYPLAESKPYDLPSSKVKPPAAKAKPTLPVALLFPGQGSQYVGMMKDLLDLPGVVKLLDISERVLGWNVKNLCLNGPEAQLSETKYCQPAMFIAGMAGIESMKDSAKLEVVERPQAVAGLSLGEYTAICAAGVLTFEECLSLVKIRAEAMQEATGLVPQCMCSVAGLDRPTLDKLCVQAREAKVEKEPVCQIANVLFPAGFTVAGTKATIDKLCKLATEARALQARVIKAGGAFHTPLMKPAEDKLARAIDGIKSKMQPPTCAIYFNVTGKKVAAGTDPTEFADLMKKQLTSEVLWEQSIKNMLVDGVKDFYEVGPLKQLKSMIKRIDQDAFKRTENISV